MLGDGALPHRGGGRVAQAFGDDGGPQVITRARFTVTPINAANLKECRDARPCFGQKGRRGLKFGRKRYGNHRNWLQKAPGYMPADKRASSITAKHALSHRVGLPNWRTDDLPLNTYFCPAGGSVIPARLSLPPEGG